MRAGVEAAAIHGNKSQSARERALEGFRRGLTPVLVATDIAARGIDVDGITHVINFDLPNVPESYVHRIGRTARAGASGVAISFCEPAERSMLVAIERFIRARIPAVNPPAPPVHGASRPVQGDASAAPRRDGGGVQGQGQGSGHPQDAAGQGRARSPRRWRGVRVG